MVSIVNDDSVASTRNIVPSSIYNFDQWEDSIYLVEVFVEEGHVVDPVVPVGDVVCGNEDKGTLD